jgi:O-antigen/teichoic acid export membrane protein
MNPILYGKKFLGSYQREIVSGCIFAFGIFTAFFGQVILSHVTSARDFGIFIVIYTAATVCSAIGSSGFDLSAVRFVAVLKREKSYPLLRRFLRYCARTTLWMSIGAVFCFAAYVSISEKVGHINLIISVVLVYFWSCTRSLAGAVRGFEALTLAIAIDRVFRDFAVFALALVAYLLGAKMPAYLALLALLAGTLLGLLSGILDTKAKLRMLPGKDQIDHRQDDDEREWGRASRGLMRYNLVELFSSRFDIFLLSLLIATEQVGAVAIAIILLNIVSIPSIFLHTLLMPKMAVASQTMKPAELVKQFKWVTLIAVGSGMAIATIMYLGQSLILSLISSAMVGMLNWDLVFIALFVRALSLVSTFPAVLLTMTGRHNELLVAQLSSMVFRLGIYGIFLSHPTADMGVGAFVAGFVVVAAISLFQVRRQIWGAKD